MVVWPWEAVIIIIIVIIIFFPRLVRELSISRVGTSSAVGCVEIESGAAAPIAAAACPRMRSWSSSWSSRTRPRPQPRPNLTLHFNTDRQTFVHQVTACCFQAQNPGKGGQTEDPAHLPCSSSSKFLTFPRFHLGHLTFRSSKKCQVICNQDWHFGT